MGLDSERHKILKSKIALTLQHQILNGKCPSHIISGLSKGKQYTGVHIQANVLPISCHDRHWPWRNTERYNTMFIFMYDHPLWWKSIIIIKNKQSHLHGIVIRLGGFSHHYKFTWGSGSHHGRLESLVITCTQLCWKHSDPNLRRQCFLHMMAKDHLLEDDGLDKTIAAKMLGMLPPVDCWGLGSWW